MAGVLVMEREGEREAHAGYGSEPILVCQGLAHHARRRVKRPAVSVPCIPIMQVSTSVTTAVLTSPKTTTNM